MTPDIRRVSGGNSMSFGARPSWCFSFVSLCLLLWNNNNVCVHACLVAKSCLTLCTPWTVARHSPLVMGFPRQEYWSGLSLPPPGDLPDPGIKPSLLHCRKILYPLSHQGTPIIIIIIIIICTLLSP